MNFRDARTVLEGIFLANNFELSLKKGLKHTQQRVLETCSSGTIISVSFPGYKAQMKQGKVVYDYRIDIEMRGLKTALSHANIIVDIYNKIRNGGLFALGMGNALIEVSEDSPFALKSYGSDLAYSQIKPPDELLHKMVSAHGEKSFNKLGNSFDLTLEELFKSIKWIVVQEDINYPIEAGFEGRRMAFARYLEAVFVSQNDTYQIEEVIARALAHRRVKPWLEMDYTFLKNIN
ncbi:MAG: hypothetical protein ACI9IP_001374 [Arcticibacterium sp.]|jgi:hypothetical protein